MQDHKEWVKKVFDRASASYGEKGCCFFEYFGTRLVELAKLARDDQILDVATGKGAVLFPAAQVVGPQGKALGIDISSQMIEDAQAKAPYPWIELQQMDAEHLLLPDHSFDVVFCAFALFFFPSAPQALSEFKRVLKPGGRLAVSTFSQRAVLDRWIVEKMGELGMTSGVNTISIDAEKPFMELLVPAGFSSIEFHRESKVFYHENAEQWWSSLSGLMDCDRGSSSFLLKI
ncbi:MAG: methyltransferase domain-containing protein [Verrucomicrobia bacterium]|nr:methyltransferase domain-containing protein [Verrucomicrobiota bacterium]